MDNLCIRCKGKGFCGGPCKILSRFREAFPKPKIHFSGESPPEVFVGRVGYPFVNSGVFAPSDGSSLAGFSTAEEWSGNNFSIENILRVRSRLVYGRDKIEIKSRGNFKKIIQELALSSKPLLTEFFLKKKPKFGVNLDSVFRPIMNSAPIDRVLLEENPKVLKKVDYLTSDSDSLAITAMRELYSSIDVDHIQKLLSVGLLGLKSSRKMVPTRWAITSTDDIISKHLLEKIKYYPELNEFLVFSGNFLGNYMKVLFLPGKFSFEVVEVWFNSNSLTNSKSVTSDHETFFGRKDYASNVTGGYYAMRLPVAEYFDKMRRQATVLVFREVLPEYYAPLGVGIVRECTRRAFSNPPERFDSLQNVLSYLKRKIKISLEELNENSWLLKNYGKQKTLNDFN
ncbi:MAG: hypothetical protein WC494_03325 [Candidatus Pacearchaeota archaeon]